MDQELYKLISRAKNGEKEAFTLLVKRYKESVFRYSYAMLADRMEAEDVSQQAFINAFYSLTKLENIYAFSSWLTRIVSNLCYDRIKKRKKEAAVTSELMETHNPNSNIEHAYLHMTIEEAMDKLSFEHRFKEHLIVPIG